MSTEAQRDMSLIQVSFTTAVSPCWDYWGVTVDVDYTATLLFQTGRRRSTLRTEQLVTKLLDDVTATSMTDDRPVV